MEYRTPSSNRNQRPTLTALSKPEPNLTRVNTFKQRSYFGLSEHTYFSGSSVYLFTALVYRAFCSFLFVIFYALLLQHCKMSKTEFNNQVRLKKGHDNSFNNLVHCHSLTSNNYFKLRLTYCFPGFYSDLKFL